MCFVKYCILFFCLLSVNCYALNCRTNGGPKESELKSIFMKCLKMQDGKNSSEVRGNDDHDFNDSRGHKQQNDWEKDRVGNTEDMRHRNNGMSDYDDRMSSNDKKRKGSDKMDTNNDRASNNKEQIGSRNGKMGHNDKSGNGNDMIGSHDDRKRNDHLSGRNDFQNEDYADMGNYNGYYSSTPASRRYKRERRINNSGQRNQHTPYSQRTSGYDEANRSDERISSENSTSQDKDNKACALHCFLENLEMTGDDGIPDRYLVSHVLMKDVNNEDLRDFLQESIEECFQILDNENTEDKCEFAKNLLMCLSEKGRANCDDWKDDLRI